MDELNVSGGFALSLFYSSYVDLRICQGIEYLHNSVVFQDNWSQGNPSVLD
jgi:hypothetical protein